MTEARVGLTKKFEKILSGQVKAEVYTPSSGRSSVELLNWSIEEVQIAGNNSWSHLEFRRVGQASSVDYITLTDNGVPHWKRIKEIFSQERWVSGHGDMFKPKAIIARDDIARIFLAWMEKKGISMQEVLAKSLEVEEDDHQQQLGI